jgi:hypothetical protein
MYPRGAPRTRHADCCDPREVHRPMARSRGKVLLALALGSLAMVTLAGHRGLRRVAHGAEGAGPLPALPTLVVLPDTQYYAATFPQIVATQTAWITLAQHERHIVAAVQLGDLVDQVSDAAQWDAVSAAFRMLDGRVPYLLVPGNHDTDRDRVGPLDDYFPRRTMPWLAGTMTAGQVENSFLEVDIGSRRWLLVGLEFGPRDAALAWADAVLKSHASLPAIVVTHAYLYGDGNRYGTPRPGHADRPSSGQAFAPALFSYTPTAGINDGEQIWHKLVLPNPNVQLVLCGHDNGVARLTSRRPDGSRVHQLLSDYQWLYQGTPAYAGGSGFLRLLEFDEERQQIQVRTYSPYLDRYLTDEGNQFTLDLDLQRPSMNDAIEGDVHVGRGETSQ